MAEISTAVIGNGWVGRSMTELFPDSIVYDEPQIREQHPEDYQVAIDAGRLAVNSCNVAFVGVPTPNLGEGRLDTSIVEEVIEWCESDLIVIRSTVNPGDTERLAEKYGKHIVFQPEYLGESPAHPMLDPKTRQFIILGGEPADRRKAIEAYTAVYNANTNIRQMTSTEAEVVKLSENRAIALRVAEAQELYEACELAGIDYYTIREAVYGDDPRMNMWWTFIYPDKRGMNSKCIPKDVYAWAAWAESLGYDPVITQAVLDKNKDWLKLNA